MKADIRMEHQLLAVEAEHEVNAMLELVAPGRDEAAARPPLSLAVVIDRSGSMEGEKLETTKRCARFLVDRLLPTDRLALITYDDEVELVAPLAPVDAAALGHAIAGIWSGGSTNLSGGWLKGAEVLLGADGDGPRKVLLLTDGHANVGVADPVRLAGMAREAAANGVGTSTVGFGHGFDEDLLTAIADAGHGNAYFAATPDDAPGIFAQEFEGLLSLVAQNVSVEIRPSEDVQLLAVLNEYPGVGVPGGVQLQLGDAYADERRRVVFRLHIPGMAQLGVAKVADVVIRYAGVGERIALHEVTVPMVVNLVSADEAASVEPDAEVVEEVLVLEAAKAQDEAIRRADGGDLEGARKLLHEVSEKLRRHAPTADRAEELLEQAERLEERHGAFEMGMYSAEMRKDMRYEIHSRRRGRPHKRQDPGDR
jgi:Ca-activated chloride channel homolog